MGLQVLRIIVTAWVVGLVPVYWRHYGPANFLWFSDLALFLTTISLWTGNRWPVSMAAVSVLLLEVVWNIDLLLRLVAGVRPVGLTDYMFDPSYPLYVRLLSLFHVWMPPLMLWLLHRNGYEPRAWIAQTAVAWVILPLAFWLGPEGSNINWTRDTGTNLQRWLPPGGHLALVMIAFPVIVHLPTHLLLNRMFAR